MIKREQEPYLTSEYLAPDFRGVISPFRTIKKQFLASQVGRLVTAVTVAASLGTAVQIRTEAAPTCEFILGFKTIHGMISNEVGNCRENVRFNPVNGDALQLTDKGLLAWRKSDNWTAYTNGYLSWINGPYGLQQRLNTERFSWEFDDRNVILPVPTTEPIPTPTPTPEVPINFSPEVEAILNAPADMRALELLPWRYQRPQPPEYGRDFVDVFGRFEGIEYNGGSTLTLIVTGRDTLKGESSPSPKRIELEPTISQELLFSVRRGESNSTFLRSSNILESVAAIRLGARIGDPVVVHRTFDGKVMNTGYNGGYFSIFSVYRSEQK